MRTHAHPSTLLSAVAHLVDAASHRHGVDLAVLLLDDADEPEQLSLAVRPLPPGVHPSVALADVVLPDACWGVALALHGLAHHLDALDEPAQPIVSTYLRHRDGRQVSLLRRGERVTEQRGRLVGRVPDLCRRLLAGPTTGGGPAGS